MTVFDGNKKCKTCGAKGDCDGTIDKCVNCWEVEKRLDDYLKSDKGKLFVINAIERIGGEDWRYNVSVIKKKKKKK